MGVFGFGLLYVLYHIEELSGVRTAVTYPSRSLGCGIGLRKKGKLSPEVGKERENGHSRVGEGEITSLCSP
jgi:hypothetical protein